MLKRPLKIYIIICTILITNTLMIGQKQNRTIDSLIIQSKSKTAIQGKQPIHKSFKT